MARIFISYRRADGQYAVGWIQERLKALQDERHLEVVFFDENLSIGDPLSEALAERIATCEVLIAVIGPDWRGARADGTARILDSSDWVGVELAAALQAGKRIFPVLINGAEPLDKADLAPELHPLADLLAIKFDEKEALDQLERGVRSYLAKLDTEIAEIEGLDEPLNPPSTVPPLRATALIAMAVLVAGLAGWLLAGLEDDSTFRIVSVSVMTAAAGAVGAFGVWYLSAILTPHIELGGRWTRAEGRWKHVLFTMAIVMSILLWGGTQYGSLDGDAKWTTVISALVLLLIAPMMLVMIVTAFTDPPEPAEPETGNIRTRARVEAVAERTRAGVVSTSLLSLVATVVVVSSAATLLAEPASSAGAMTTLVSFGALMTVMLFAVFVHGRTRLIPENRKIKAVLHTIATRYVEEFDDYLFDEPVAPGQQVLLAPIIAPFAVGLALGLAYPYL